MITEARKLCGGCGNSLPLDSFYVRSRSPDGLQSYCKACNRKAVDAYQSRIGKSVVHRSVRYGLKPDDVRELLKLSACQSCGQQLPDSASKKFDHCHTGGHFRGVICHACNVACQGTSEEAIVRLQCCIAYLQRDLERTA